MKALFALLVVAAGLAPSAWGQHFTARLFTAGHRPQHVKQLLFSPTGAYLAAHADDGVHFFHVATGRETKSYRVNPLAMAFTPSGHQLLAVASDGAAYLPSEEGIATNAKWQLPLGYLGVTFVKQSGKILVEQMTPGGPAALSGQIHVGDEIVAVTTGGEDISVLGDEISHLLDRLAGLAGTDVSLKVVPHGQVEPVAVRLRRAGGAKLNNQVTLLPFVAQASPQAMLVRWRSNLVILDAGTGLAISALQPTEVEVFGMSAFAPDGKRLAFTARRLREVRGEPELMMEVYDVAKQARIASAPVDVTKILDQRFLPDGKRVALGTKDRILVFDSERSAFVHPILIGFDPSRYQPKENPKSDEFYSPLNVGVGLDHLQAAETPRRVEYPEQLLASFDVSPDGKLVAVGSCRGELRLFSTTEHQELAKIGERTLEEVLVEPVAFSPDGQWLAYYLAGTLHWQTVASVLADHAFP